MDTRHNPDDCLCDDCVTRMMAAQLDAPESKIVWRFTLRPFSTLVGLFGIPYVAMVGFHHLHEDAPAVPPLGYWSLFFIIGAVLSIGYAVKERRSSE